MDLTQIFCQDCRVLWLKNFDENLILAEFVSCCPIGDRYSKLDINKDPFLQDSGPVNSVVVTILFVDFRTARKVMDQRLIFVATMLLIFPSIAALGKILS